MVDHTIAYEMLGEIKKSNRRWFAIAIIELIIIISMIVGFFIYESQFEYVTSTTTEQSQEAISTDSSSINQAIN